MGLRGGEGRIGRVLPQRGVGDHRGRTGGGEGAQGGGRGALSHGSVIAALERENVSVQPGQQVQATTKTGVRQLRQVGVEVDQPRHDHERAQIDDGRGRRLGIPPRPHPHDATISGDLDQPVIEVEGASVGQRRQQARAKGEGGGFGKRRHRRRCYMAETEYPCRFYR